MSNQLEEIQKLYAKKKTYKIPKEAKDGVDQINLEISPLTLDEIGLLTITKDTPPQEAAEITKKMIAKSLGVEVKEASGISIEHIEDILSAISDANNFNEEDVKKVGIKEFLGKKKQQIAEAKVEDSGKPDKPTQE